MNYVAELIILAFLAIVFLESSIDKITNWKGNIKWMKPHFSKTILKNKVRFSLGIILFFEITTGILAILSILSILINQNTKIALITAVIASVCLLFLLLGQRLAKDYDGARTIVIYLIPTLFLIYLISINIK